MQISLSAEIPNTDLICQIIDMRVGDDHGGRFFPFPRLYSYRGVSRSESSGGGQTAVNAGDRDVLLTNVVFVVDSDLHNHPGRIAGE